MTSSHRDNRVKTSKKRAVLGDVRGTQIIYRSLGTAEYWADELRNGEDIGVNLISFKYLILFIKKG